MERAWLAANGHHVLVSREDSQRVAHANLRWIRDFYAAMRPYVAGFAYQNYIDPYLREWQHAYYGINFPPLMEVKAHLACVAIGPETGTTMQGGSS
jgi:Berberine and berberine like